MSEHPKDSPYSESDPVVVASFVLANEHARGRYTLDRWLRWLNDGERSVVLAYDRMATALDAAGLR